MVQYRHSAANDGFVASTIFPRSLLLGLSHLWSKISDFQACCLKRWSERRGVQAEVKVVQFRSLDHFLWPDGRQLNHFPMIMPIDCEGHLSEPPQSQLLGFHEVQKETGHQTARIRINCRLAKPKSYLRLINCEIKTHFNLSSVFGYTTDEIERLKALLGKRIFLPSFTIILMFL